jgi:spore germination protein (amino acid permease)
MIGRWGIICMLIPALCTKIFLNFPRSTIEVAGTAGWLLVIYLTAIVLVLFSAIIWLYKPFTGKDLLDLGEIIGGNIGRIFVGIIILAFFMLDVTIVLREFGENMKIIGYKNSPISFVLLIFSTVMVFSAFFGLETISRLASILTVTTTLTFIAIIIMDSKYYDFSNIFPILGTGPYDIFGKGFVKLSYFGELIILFLLTPYIKSNKEFKTIGYIAIGISSIFMLTSSFVFTLVFPYPSNTEGFLPMYELARLINYARFFQRVESFFVFFWILGALLYLSIGIIIIVNVFKKTFKLQYSRPIIIPFAIILFTLSFYSENLVSSVKLETDYLRNIAWIFTFILPIILLVMARLINKQKKKKIKNSAS